MLADAYGDVLGQGGAPGRAAALVAAVVVHGVGAICAEVPRTAAVATHGRGAAPAVAADLDLPVLLEVRYDLGTRLFSLEVLDDLVRKDA